MTLGAPQVSCINAALTLTNPCSPILSLATYMPLVHELEQRHLSHAMLLEAWQLEYLTSAQWS